MSPIFARTLATLGLVSHLWACSGDESDSSRRDDSLAGSAGGDPAPAPLASTPREPAAPSSGQGDTTPPRLIQSNGGIPPWDIASLEKRLDLQGMAPRKQPVPVRHPFLSVPGTKYLVGNAELQVFIYPDAAALDRDLATMDTINVAPRGEKVKWPDKPTLIRNNNLAAILLGQNALQIERVQRALMAGLPPSP